MPRAHSSPARRAQPACELCSVAVRVPQCMTSVLALVCLRMMCSTTACTRMIFYAEAVGFFGLPTIMLCPCPRAFPSCPPAPPLLLLPPTPARMRVPCTVEHAWECILTLLRSFVCRPPVNFTRLANKFCTFTGLFCWQSMLLLLQLPKVATNRGGERGTTRKANSKVSTTFRSCSA